MFDVGCENSDCGTRHLELGTLTWSVHRTMSAVYFHGDDLPFLLGNSYWIGKGG
jgi:hypothetical protein